jgi:hypothetical protein
VPLDERIKRTAGNEAKPNTVSRRGRKRRGARREKTLSPAFLSGLRASARLCVKNRFIPVSRQRLGWQPSHRRNAGDVDAFLRVLPFRAEFRL